MVIELEQLLKKVIDEKMVTIICEKVNKINFSLQADERWRIISKEILTPEHPFQLHQFLFETVYSDWRDEQGPPPVWFSTREESLKTNIGGILNDQNFLSYQDFHSWSVNNRTEFWRLLVNKLKIKFKKPYDAVLGNKQNLEKPGWFKGSKLNITDSCFQTFCEKTAIVFQKTNGAVEQWSYLDLEQLTNRVSNSLIGLGYQQGDALAIFMPMTAESVAIYLGIIQAGCCVISIADSFAEEEITRRLKIANARGIFTQDYMVRGGKSIPFYSRLNKDNGPPAIVLPFGSQLSVDLLENDLSWDDFLTQNDQFKSIACNPDDMTNILFSSGTTGDPKAIPWTHTTPIKCASDAYLHHDIHPEDTLCWPTNLGWMMGPWLIYASLINGATMALYYDVPTTRGFCEFVQKVDVSMLGVVPSLVRRWKNTQCINGLDWSSIKLFSSTGECSNRQDMHYLMSQARYRPVIEYCGGTEIGGGYITGTLVQNASPATFSTPALGMDFTILGEDSQSVENGEIFLKPPSVGLSEYLLNGDHHKIYYDGLPKYPQNELLRRHGDQIERLPGGYFRALGRVDETMNLSGIKISSAEIERSLLNIIGVEETVAIAVTLPEGSPNLLVIYIILEEETNLEIDTLKQLMQKRISKHLNPLIRIHDVEVIHSLPRTASNKIMRRLLRDQYSASNLRNEDEKL